MEPLIFLVVMFAIFWLLIVRPQRRRRTQHAQLVEGLAAGDEIVTSGGLYGRIQELGDEVLTVEIAPGTTVRVARGAIAGVVSQRDEAEAAPTESG